MAPGVVADLMALSLDSAQQVLVHKGLLADDKEDRRNLLPLEHIQYLWRPLRIRAVIERKDNLLLLVIVRSGVPAQYISRRQHRLSRLWVGHIICLSDQSALWINFDRASPLLRLCD